MMLKELRRIIMKKLIRVIEVMKRVKMKLSGMVLSKKRKGTQKLKRARLKKKVNGNRVKKKLSGM